MLAIGLMLALFAASRLAARDGLPRERIYDLGLWTIIGGLIGSKILMFFVEDNVNLKSCGIKLIPIEQQSNRFFRVLCAG